MVLLGASTDELMLKLYHSEQTISLFVSELQLQIDGLASVRWTDGHSKSSEADVIDHDEAPLSTEGELEGGKDGFSPGEDVQLSFLIDF